MKYEWNREMTDHGTLYPTRVTEYNPGGKMVRDYAMMKLPSDENRYNTAHWERKAGSEPASKDFYGSVMVDSNGNGTLSFRNPFLTEKINADGNTSKSGVDKNLKRINEQHRRTK